jgi:hypothetical protein
VIQSDRKTSLLQTMAELKTKKTRSSVTAFLNSIPETQKREDCWAIAKMMRAATKAAPKMWGASIVGFGHCCLVYPSGKEIDWMQVAFSPRKANITLHQEALRCGHPDAGETDPRDDTAEGRAFFLGRFATP